MEGLEVDNRGGYILELEAKVRVLELQIVRLKKWIFDEIGKEPPENLLSENVKDYSGDQDQNQSEDYFIGPDSMYDNDDAFIGVDEFDLENVKIESINDEEHLEQGQCENEVEQPQQQDNDINGRIVGDSMSKNGLQFVKTGRGKPALVHDGFVFIFNKNGSNGKKIWRCIKWSPRNLDKCQGRCHSDSEKVIFHSDNHNHPPDPDPIKVDGNSSRKRKMKRSHTAPEYENESEITLNSNYACEESSEIEKIDENEDHQQQGQVHCGNEVEQPQQNNNTPKNTMTLKFVKTAKGKPALIHDGFVFIFERNGSCGKKIWRCVKWSARKLDTCPGRCHTNSEKVISHSDHTHLPDPIAVHRYSSRKRKEKRSFTQKPSLSSVQVPDNESNEHHNDTSRITDTCQIREKKYDFSFPKAYIRLVDFKKYPRNCEFDKIGTKTLGKVVKDFDLEKIKGDDVDEDHQQPQQNNNIPKNAMTLQFVKTAKGKPALIHDGFIFIFEKPGSGGKKIWRCVKWSPRKLDKCPGRCHTDSEKVISHQNNHNHLPDSTEVDRYSLYSFRKSDLQDQDGRNVCPICSKEFKFYTKLRIHMTIHDKNREKKSLCSFCGKAFYEESHVKRHIQQCHPEHSNKPDTDEIDQLCTLCGKIYNSAAKLYRHMKYHEKKSLNQTFICSFCGATLKSIMAFKSHINLHTREKQWKCSYPQCAGSGKVYFAHQNLKLHILKIHTKNAPTFNCDFPGCTRSFKLKSVLNWHKDIHKKDRSHVCKYCSKVIKSNNTLRSHISKHHRQDRFGPDYPFKCERCGQRFKEERWLKGHFDNVHGEKPKLICPHGCKNEFLNRRTLLIHLKWKHRLAGVKPFVCEIDNCNKRFQIKNHLIAHQETHINREERNYKCKYCESTFYSRTVLGGHIRKFHRDVRNLRLKCQFQNCGQTFSSTRFLEEHAETHNPDYDPYKFKCSICSKAYKIATERNRHEKVVHQDERPYKCFCGKDFKRLQHLQRHKVQTHEGKRETRKRKEASSDFLDHEPNY